MAQENLDLAVRDYSSAIDVKQRGDNYAVQLGDKKMVLVRNVDFGVIPGTKRPSLMKSGAERIVMSLGLSQRYIIESCIEHFEQEPPFAFYRVKCELFYTRPDGMEITVTEGVGSANTMEKQCGKQSPYDSANARLKMAKKRAMVDACLTVGQLSSMFSQDMENEEFMQSQTAIIDEDATITPKQLKRLFTMAGKMGVDKAKCSEIVASFGYASAKDIKVKDYDKVCDKIEECSSKEE